jgi:hypothetical protein
VTARFRAARPQGREGTAAGIASCRDESADSNARRQHKGHVQAQIKGETPWGPRGPSHRALMIARLTD